MKILLISILFSLLAATSRGEDLGKSIAETFGYPHERLTVSDRSSEYSEKSKGDYLYVLQLTSEDKTFAYTELAISKRGVMLKPELEKHYESNLGDGSGPIKKFELADGGYGYTGVGMGGPGGSEERLLATWPERGIDLLVKIKLLRDGLAPDDSLEDYQTLVTEGGQILDEKLIGSLNQLAAYAVAENIGAPTSARPKPKATRPDARANLGASTQPASEESSERQGDQPQFPLWAWVAVGLLIAFAGVLFLKRRASAR